MHDERFKLPVLCPSARCEKGSLLLGIVQEDGRVALTSSALPVDEQFVEKAHAGRSPGKRFRFANTCIQGGCRQWTGKRCGVIDTVIQDSGVESAPDTLPKCAIRPQCRWFQQHGARACVVCPEVITDLREEP